MHRLQKLDIGSTAVTKIIGAIGDRVLPVMQYFVSLFNMVIRGCIHYFINNNLVQVNGEIVRKITRVFPQLSSLHIHCTSSSEVLCIVILVAM